MKRNTGCILLDKPRGWTSHDVVKLCRRFFPNGTKVGHTGTLDPLATGLLVLLVGEETKKQAFYQNLPKTYTGRIRLGVETDTGDMDGRPIRQTVAPLLSSTFLDRQLQSFQGTISTLPPMYSAIKYRGKPLYTYARKGISVEREPRLSRIYQWRLLEYTPPEISFRLECGSGTYVRSLAMALGERLGCGAVVSELRREKIGSFSIQDALPLEKFKTLSPAELQGEIHPDFPPLSALQTTVPA